MDEYNVSMLSSSKDEFCCRIVNILSPLMIEGIVSIFKESLDLCKKNNEHDKYLMTFQNFIARIPKWNRNIIENEKKRMIDKSGCMYLEDLLTCVHIIQLKLLTAMRVGQKQKKIDIEIMKLDDFIHKTYINIARKIYKNVYLFEINIQPLLIQKNNRELEIIVNECILNTIRDSIPIETIMKAYLDETIEEDVTETINEEIIEEKINEKVIEEEIRKKEKQKLEEIQKLEENKIKNNTYTIPQKKDNNPKPDENISFFDELPVLSDSDTESVYYSQNDELSVSDIDNESAYYSENDGENDSMRLNITDIPVKLNDIEMIDNDNLLLDDIKELY